MRLDLAVAICFQTPWTSERVVERRCESSSENGEPSSSSPTRMVNFERFGNIDGME